MIPKYVALDQKIAKRPRPFLIKIQILDFQHFNPGIASGYFKPMYLKSPNRFVVFILASEHDVRS